MKSVVLSLLLLAVVVAGCLASDAGHGADPHATDPHKDPHAAGGHEDAHGAAGGHSDGGSKGGNSAATVTLELAAVLFPALVTLFHARP